VWGSGGRRVSTLKAYDKGFCEDGTKAPTRVYSSTGGFYQVTLQDTVAGQKPQISNYDTLLSFLQIPRTAESSPGADSPDSYDTLLNIEHYVELYCDATCYIQEVFDTL